MAEQRFGLLEAGSNSLKLYLVDRSAAGPSTIASHKFPWRIAHEFFATGRLSPAGAAEIIERFGQAREVCQQIEFSQVLTIATGMFRELENLDEITSSVEEEFGVRLRVISGADEAALMGRGFRELPTTPPALLCDLGGATLEWVWQGPAGQSLCGSEPLGAIRNHYRFPPPIESSARYLEESASHCDRLLAKLPATGPTEVIATGGTARTLSLLAGNPPESQHLAPHALSLERATQPPSSGLVVSLSAIESLVHQIAEDGPPPEVDPNRREILLPGLIILWRVVLHCRAGELRYGTSAVRHGMVVRLLELLERYEPKQLHATQLLRSTRETIHPPSKPTSEPPKKL